MIPFDNVVNVRGQDKVYEHKTLRLCFKGFLKTLLKKKRLVIVVVAYIFNLRIPVFRGQRQVNLY